MEFALSKPRKRFVANSSAHRFAVSQPAPHIRQWLMMLPCNLLTVKANGQASLHPTYGNG
jgi:hypothetical protein